MPPLSAVSIIAIVFFVILLMTDMTLCAVYAVQKNLSGFNRKPVLCAIIALTVCSIAGGVWASLCCISDLSNEQTGFHLTYRGARNSDITISDEQFNIAKLGKDFTFTANTNIDGLEITLYFYDENDELVNEIKRTFGNVIKGNQYTFTISVTDIGAEILFHNIQSCIGQVTGGIHRYF